jgi:hypothetical protein
VHLPCDQACGGKLAEALGHHALAHTGHKADDPGKAGGTIEQGRDDQTTPALSQKRKDLGDGPAHPFFIIERSHGH